MKRLRSIFCVLLVLCVILQLVPVTAQAASVKYVQTTKNSVPLRHDVGEDQTIVERVSTKGTVLTVLDSKLNLPAFTTWYLISVQAGSTQNGKGGQYWVYSGNTTDHSHALSAGACTAKGCGFQYSITTRDNTTRYMEVTRNGAPVRELPYNDGKVIREYRTGDLITTTGQRQNYKGSIWYKVNTGGYIFQDNVRMATEKKTDTVNNSINNGGFQDKKDDFISYTPKACKDHDWSVGKCVNCGKLWELKVTKVSGTFTAKSDQSVARDIPYQEGKVMRTYRKGDVVPVVSSAINSAQNPWYKTAEGYWIYGVEDSTMTGVSLKYNAYTFGSLHESFTLEPVPKPAAAKIQSVAYSSSNTAVATVDAGGVVRPIGMGEATVTCKVTSVEGTTFSTKAKIKVPEIATLEVWSYDENTFHTDLALKCSGYMSLAYPDYDYTYKDGQMIVFNTTERPTNPNNLTRLLKSEKMSYKIYNYNAMNHFNSPIVIAEKMVNYNGALTPLLYVIIEGSAGRAGWEGDMLLTGYSYAPEKLNEHASFGAAADDMLTKLNTYISDKGFANKPLVVITGHSRGAAVGNLLGQRLNERLAAGTAAVQKVYAYNFAVPNNTKNPVAYRNLFNIVNEADLVTYIPLSNSGWDYSKHGITYVFNSTNSYKSGSRFKSIMDWQVTMSAAANRNKPDYNFCQDTAAEISDYVGGVWKNVAQFYNKSLETCDDTELYDYFLKGMARAASEPKDSSVIIEHLLHPEVLATSAGESNDASVMMVPPRPVCPYMRLSTFLATNAWGAWGQIAAFADSHHAYTYHGAVLAGLISGSRSVSLMDEVSLLSAAEICQEDRDVLLDYFTSSDRNLLKLEEAGWNVDDPATWTGVQVDANGRVTDLDLRYLELDGWLDVTPLTQLQTLYVDGNSIDILAVNGCENLRELHCSSNLLASLNVSQCPALEVLNCAFNQITTLDLGTDAMQGGSRLQELSCFNNKLGTLNLSGASALQTIRCSNNELTSLDISACTSLSTFFCSGNRLDENSNEALADAVAQINLNGGTAEIGRQQHNDSFAFNTAEVQALNAFAEQALNREKLGWVENDPWNWTGVEWVLFENEYRVASVELSGMELEGEFMLPDAVCLESVSCADSKLSVLNLSGCKNLSSINCHNAGISCLEVEGCDSLTALSCDENALSPEAVTSLNTSLRLNTGMIDYEKQEILADEEKFDPEERAVLIRFLSYGTNAEELGWDWDWPGTWNGIVWTRDTEADLYRVNQINLTNLQVAGTLDLSGFDYLERFDFSGSGIETVILPDCVTEIPDYAFYNSALREIYLNEGLGNIGADAFAYCTELETVVLPASVGRIGERAFYGCENLKDAVFTGAAPAAVGDEAFDLTAGTFVIRYFAEKGWTGEEAVLNTCFGEEAGGSMLLLAEEVMLDQADTYDMTNQYGGHDIELTVIAAEPGTTATVCLAVYDDKGAMVEVQMLPVELNRTMNRFCFKDVDVQYVGESFCQIKLFLLREDGSLIPAAVNLEQVLKKPQAD